MPLTQLLQLLAFQHPYVTLTPRAHLIIVVFAKFFLHIEMYSSQLYDFVKRMYPCRAHSSMIQDIVNNPAKFPQSLPGKSVLSSGIFVGLFWSLRHPNIGNGAWCVRGV